MAAMADPWDQLSVMSSSCQKSSESLMDLRRTDVPSDLPWDHVEEMTTFLPCEYALAYLQRCPDLVEWSYADTSRFGAGQMYLPRPCITLPRLKTLSVHFSHGSDTGLLYGTTTPALQDCALRFISGFNPMLTSGSAISWRAPRAHFVASCWNTHHRTS